jgi:ribose 1,5-bisphosphate isomerase
MSEVTINSLVKDIKSLKIQSARTITIRSLDYLYNKAKKDGFGDAFWKDADRILNTRPTAVVLHNCIEEVKKEQTLMKIRELLKELKNTGKLVSRHVSKIFPKRKVVKVMTHCHSTTVVQLLINAKRRGTNLEVYVTETRPKDQGLLTAKDLTRAKIKTKYLVDSASGFYMPKIDLVLFGADALRREGVVNKVGTYPMSVVANENSKPVFIITSKFTLDRRKNFEIENRPVSEITHARLRGVEILNPAFDITPWKYISYVVTEDGVKKPKDILREFGDEK